MKIFLTAQELIDHIKETYGVADDTALQDTLWFICIQEARSLSESTLKDIGRMLLDGIASYATNPMESIQTYLDTLYEDLKEAIAGGDVILSMGEVNDDSVYDIIPDLEEHFNGIRRE